MLFVSLPTSRVSSQSSRFHRQSLFNGHRRTTLRLCRRSSVESGQPLSSPIVSIRRRTLVFPFVALSRFPLNLATLNIEFRCPIEFSGIVGPAGNVQAAMLNRQTDEPQTTQEFVNEIAKATYDRDFKSNP
ncbi:hypothetical protein V8G54_029036 [Vigna mungo]|uniref:Uncharacterized protein n=1 Tax=Vigna mungo TaxID=3915 RepID=A0AAQ3MTV5_VIGMU